ncbi:VENN motif pre-toxin domain-containing protein [Aeromonas sobria]|uniref:VENN motif pre-toxin domain-containing protein n=1 Tax=Aeromonas sobria TaxID=646 RepID=UPI0018E2F77B|nr:VENN motif pre-toxin domain-containing protein [Aeromonas sobria]
MPTLLRDPSKAANGLSPIFDKKKELEKLQEVQLIGEIGQQATQLVVSEKMGKAEKDARENKEYANSPEYKALQEKWGVGSDFQRGMQAATAALQGLAGGGLAEAAAGAASPYLAKLVKDKTDEGSTSRIIAHALAQGALAAAQNKSSMVGATGAATGELVGIIAAARYNKEVSQLSESEKETVSTLATLAAGLAGGLTGDNTASALAGAQTGKTVVENNSLAGDKARESLKGSNEWWKQRVRDTLGENTSSQITNGVLNALAEVGDTGLLAADSAFDVAAALVTCSLGEAYCNQAKSDLGKKNQAASDAMNAVMSGDAWAAVKGTVGKAVQGDQVALENLAGVLASALVPVKGAGLVKGGDRVVTVVSKETGSKLLTAGEKGAGQVLREVEVSSGGKGSWTKELNKPEPNTIYKVDGNKVYQTDSLVRVKKLKPISR